MNGVLEAKVLYSTVFLSAAMLLWCLGRESRTPILRPCMTWAPLVVMAAHASLIIVLYVVMGLPPQGDLGGYYIPQARAVVRGEIPYRDFQSSYGVLFPYLVALVTVGGQVFWLWPMFSVALLMVAAWLLFTIPYCALFRNNAFIFWFLLLINPITLWFVTATGSNNVIVALLVVSALRVGTSRTAERRPCFAAVASAMVATASVPLAKLIGLVPTVGLASLRMGALVGLASAALMSAYWGLSVAITGFNPIQPLSEEVTDWTPSNVWYISSLLGTDMFENSLGHATVGLVLLCYGVLLLRRTKARAKPRISFDAIAAAPCAAFFLFQLLSPKSYTSYAVMILPLLTLLVSASDKDVRIWLAYCAYSACASLDMSLWFRAIGNGPLYAVWTTTMHWGGLFVVTQLVIVTASAYLAFRMIRISLGIDHLGRRVGSLGDRGG